MRLWKEQGPGTSSHREESVDVGMKVCSLSDGYRVEGTIGPRLESELLQALFQSTGENLFGLRKRIPARTKSRSPAPVQFGWSIEVHDTHDVAPNQSKRNQV
jgi:hypothetical protein